MWESRGQVNWGHRYRDSGDNMMNVMNMTIFKLGD